MICCKKTEWSWNLVLAKNKEFTVNVENKNDQLVLWLVKNDRSFAVVGNREGKVCWNRWIHGPLCDHWRQQVHQECSTSNRQVTMILQWCNYIIWQQFHHECTSSNLQVTMILQYDVITSHDSIFTKSVLLVNWQVNLPLLMQQRYEIQSNVTKE